MAIPKAANDLHNTFTNTNNEGLPSTIIFSHNNQRSLPQPSEFVTFGQVAISPPWRRGFSQRGVTGCGAWYAKKKKRARESLGALGLLKKVNTHTHTQWLGRQNLIRVWSNFSHCLDPINHLTANEDLANLMILLAMLTMSGT